MINLTKDFNAAVTEAGSQLAGNKPNYPVTVDNIAKKKEEKILGMPAAVFFVASATIVLGVLAFYVVKK